jgi:hypothetical protein
VDESLSDLWHLLPPELSGLKEPIDSIWDDRVLNRAYEVFGGIPEVQLVDVGESVPQEVKEGLVGMVSRSDGANLSETQRSPSALTQR